MIAKTLKIEVKRTDADRYEDECLYLDEEHMCLLLRLAEREQRQPGRQARMLLNQAIELATAVRA